MNSELFIGSLILYLFLLLVLFIAVLIILRVSNRTGRPISIRDYDPYAIACLHLSLRHVLRIAAMSLHQRGMLILEKGRLIPAQKALLSETMKLLLKPKAAAEHILGSFFEDGSWTYIDGDVASIEIPPNPANAEPMRKRSAMSRKDAVTPEGQHPLEQEILAWCNASLLRVEAFAEEKEDEGTLLPAALLHEVAQIKIRLVQDGFFPSCKQLHLRDLVRRHGGSFIWASALCLALLILNTGEQPIPYLIFLCLAFGLSHAFRLSIGELRSTRRGAMALKQLRKELTNIQNKSGQLPNVDNDQFTLLLMATYGLKSPAAIHTAAEWNTARESSPVNWLSLPKRDRPLQFRQRKKVQRDPKRNA